MQRSTIWVNKKGLNEKCHGRIKNGKGAMTMGFDNRDGITGIVSYFVYDNGIIALGTDISSYYQNNEKEIRTTINQCVLEDNFNVDGEKVTKGAYYVGDNVITNGAFSYYNLDTDQTMILTATDVTGSWKRNATTRSDEPITVGVFNIGIHHGTNPTNSTYAYAVIDANKELNVERIVNTSKIQGVEFKNGDYILVFHSKGEYKLKSGKTITSNGGIVIK